MPRPMRAQTQSDALYIAEELLAASLVLDDDPDLELFADEAEFEADFVADDTLEPLELSALNWVAIAEEMVRPDFNDEVAPGANDNALGSRIVTPVHLRPCPDLSGLVRLHPDLSVLRPDPRIRLPFLPDATSELRLASISFAVASGLGR
ncbi:hypothetical protein K438DRAFT_1988196 [Mycena galopus ATCC 62051]|nr:hypothetical protein K438DRAFT_1988196 [Mycena galopus ATCC 62051]